MDRPSRRAHVASSVLDAATATRTVLLPDDVGHYVGTVLRLRDGDPLELFDGRGRVAHGRLRAGPPVTLDVESVETRPDPLPPLVIAQALVRGAKLDEVVQRGTELGASRVVVFSATRSVVKGERVRLDRLTKIAAEAARQSGRTSTTVVEGAVSFDALCAEARAFPGAVVVAHPAAELPLRVHLEGHPTFAAAGLLAVIGPEGGLTDDELAALTAHGAAPVRLGVFVLRTETAGLAALCAAQSALGVL